MISVKDKQTQELNRLQSLKDTLKHSLKSNSEKHAELSERAQSLFPMEEITQPNSNDKGKQKEDSSSSSSSSSGSDSSDSSSSNSNSSSGSSSSEAEEVHGELTIEKEERRANKLLRKENKKLLKKAGSIRVEFSDSSDSSSSSSSSDDENSLLKGMKDESEGEADEEGKKSKKKKKSKKIQEEEEEEEETDDSFIVDDDYVEVYESYEEDNDGALKGRLHKYRVNKVDNQQRQQSEPLDDVADDSKDTPNNSESESNSETERMKSKKSKKNKKKDHGEYFLDNMSEGNRKRKTADNADSEDDRMDEDELLEENQERFYQQEYQMDRNIPIPEDLYVHYKNYFILTASSALKPKWKESLKEKKVELRKQLDAIYDAAKSRPTGDKVKEIETNIKIIEAQLKSEKTIKEYILRCMFFIMSWIRTGINSGREQHRKTMRKLDSILLSEKASNIKSAKFEKFPNAQGTCHVSGGPIRKGQGWLVTVTKMDDVQVTYLMDAKWQQFLSYWLNIYSHQDIIRNCAQRQFEKSGANIGQEFAAFKEDSNMNKFIRTFMASLAWIYKMLRDTQFDEPFRNSFPERWYNVCKINNELPIRTAKKSKK